jgi:ABC-type antimicrobial peptide transport system, ATPase component
MLETKNLGKVYRPKHGVSVTALKDISIRFPETGMVFLLGRSGSGKSTLLNLLGGLDRYDSGEILLDGISTKDFSQADVDSYRNACLGFVFQEYNVLPEFTVGVNIALALELQGKTATSEDIARILDEVDLAGYAARRPNELSGGQLQRVAIARALVKNPKIILADEPTGALDSATGRQVFETLKKLSETKLVIIVSHDREYSEQYADRIIELADGRIISDVTKESVDTETTAKHALLENGVCRVPGGYQLTAEDREAINRYIAEHPQEQLRIRVDENLTKGFSFEPTKEQPEVESKGLFEKIRSKLPMRRAFRIGVAGLRSKKIKLVFTVLMSMLAFSLFGLASTIADYDYVKTVSDAFRKEGVKSVYVEKEIALGGLDEYGRTAWRSSYRGTFLSDDREMAPLFNLPGVSVNPVYRIGRTQVSYQNSDDSDYEGGFNFLGDMNIDRMSNWLEIDEELLELYGCKLVLGELPDGAKDEIAISKVMYDMIRNNALMSGSKVPKMSDMIGRKVTILNYAGTDGNNELTITGIIDTGLDYMSYVNRITELFGSLTENRNRISLWSEVLAMVAVSDFNYDVKSNPASCNLVGKGYVERQLLARFCEVEGYVQLLNVDGYDSQIDGIMIADITSVEQLRHLDIQGQICKGGKDSIPVYISRKLAAEFLASVLTSNNRKFFGLDETIREAYRKQFDFDEDNPDDLTDETQDGENGTGENKKEDEYDESKYGFGDGKQYSDGYVTIQERLENSSYLSGLSDQEILKLLTDVLGMTTFDIAYYDNYEYYNYYDGTTKYIVTLDVLGILASGEEGAELQFGYAIAGDPALLEKYIGKVNQPYSGAMVRIPTDKGDLEDFVRYTHEGLDGVRFQMQTKYNVEIDAADIAMSIIGKVLIGIGVFFAIFAALLMTSFIASSIVYKKREVGILRAIGSRGADVYRIFGSESCVIALICTIFAVILTAILAGLGNYYIISTFHVSLLRFGIRQILLIALVAFVTALVASFLPVYMFAKKRPIDAIRGR